MRLRRHGLSLCLVFLVAQLLLQGFFLQGCASFGSGSTKSTGRPEGRPEDQPGAQPGKQPTHQTPDIVEDGYVAN